MARSEDNVKEFLMSFVRSKRREVSLRAALRQCEPAADAAIRKQLEEEIAFGIAAREDINKAAGLLFGMKQDVISERYLTPIPIRHGGVTVGWRLRKWEEIAEAWGYTRRHILRIHGAALRDLSVLPSSLCGGGRKEVEE